MHNHSYILCLPTQPRLRERTVVVPDPEHTYYTHTYVYIYNFQLSMNHLSQWGGRFEHFECHIGGNSHHHRHEWNFVPLG